MNDYKIFDTPELDKLSTKAKSVYLFVWKIILGYVSILKR